MNDIHIEERIAVKSIGVPNSDTVHRKCNTPLPLPIISSSRTRSSESSPVNTAMEYKIS